MDNPNVDEFLAHHGVKGQKWGVRKSQPPPSSMDRIMANPYVRLAKGTKEGNYVNLAVTAAGIAAVATSAPISGPILVGGTVSARLAIKSYEAYKMFYEKHPAPAKILPKPSAEKMARLRTGQAIREQLVKEYGKQKI